jgi:murein DD-endopeptidase MepM/ murein hydrolase activator NlpD
MRTPLKYICVTQPFGFTDNKEVKDWYKNGFHQGIDFRAPIGTIVYSSINGVSNVYTTEKGGLSIQIINGSERIFICHLSEALIEKDVMVKTGEPIGKTGNSGKYTTGPHLHFSSILGDKYVKPEFNELWDGTKINPKDFEKSYAYHRYGRKASPIAEFTMRFKNPWLHKKMTQRFGYPLPTAEIVNALVYGGWSWGEIADDGMYQTWSKKCKY